MMNQIIHGNFYEELPKIRTNTVDMILTDLPYNVTQNAWDVELDLRKMWNLFNHVLKDSGACVLTSIQPFTSKLVMSNQKNFKYEWVWNKKRVAGFLNAKKQPLRNHESVLVFYKEQPTYNPQFIKKNTVGHLSDKLKPDITKNYGSHIKMKSKNQDNELGYPKSILNHIPVINNLTEDKQGLHPTQKPIAFFEYLIKTYTNEGDTVLDCCAGSGTTVIACLNTNRNYICIEKEKKYFDIMKERITKHNE